MVFVNPYSSHLGVWTDPFKALALSGGAFVVAGSFAEAKTDTETKSLGSIPWTKPVDHLQLNLR